MSLAPRKLNRDVIREDTGEDMGGVSGVSSPEGRTNRKLGAIQRRRLLYDILLEVQPVAPLPPRLARGDA